MLEAILYDRDLSVQEFAGIYKENPSKLWKIVVKNKDNFKTIDDESRLTNPIELQKDLDKLVAQAEEGKSFIRPSGTEDILRLYCEATTTEAMNKMAEGVLELFKTKYKDL